MLAICVRFCSCLCKVCSLVSETLLLALWTLSLSFLTSNSSSDSKAFLHFIAFSGSPTAVHRAFLFFDAKAWPQSQTDLFTCTTVWAYLSLLHSIACITLWAYLSQTHRPIALHCMHYGITLWAYLLVKDSHKRSSSTENIKSQYHYTTRSKSRDHTLPLRTCYGEVYGNIASEENG